jgi:hypothetical protein
MSSPSFIQNQRVIVTQDSNHIKASDTVYQIASLDRISGRISAVLRLDNRIVGVVDESCLKASK